MGDSTDNTNELDSYGVWVKDSNNSDNLDQMNNLTQETTDFSDSLEMPDFDEPTNSSDNEFDDLFNTDTIIPEDSTTLSEESDTTLTTDELMNITNGMENSNEEAQDISNDDMFSLDVPNFDEPKLEEPSESLSAEEPQLEESNFNDIIDTNEQTDSTETQSTATDFSFDIPDFNDATDLFKSDSPLTEENNVTEDVPVVEDMEMPTFEETSVTEDEITAQDSGTEEISLDDFMDGGFSDESVASGNNGFEPGAEPQSSSESEEVSLDDFLDEGSFESEKKQEDTIVDEKPLDMDIQFDNSVDSIQTEDNISTQSDYDMDDDDDSELITESDTIEEKIPEPENYTMDESSQRLDAEEIDLSDFGIDANAEETPVTQDVESQKVKEQIVDYDLRVDNDNTSAAPVVNVIQSSDDIEEAEEVTDDLTEALTDSKSATQAVDSSLLQQIVADLSSLKNEINALKSNITEIKNKPAQTDIDDELNFEEQKDEGGFFSQDDTDDTIALSNDELNNIMNTADISTVDVDSSQAMDNFEDASQTVEEQPEETEIVEDTFDIGEETAVSDEEVSGEFNYNFDEEKLEEPNIDDIPTPSEEDLPEEIAISKDENPDSEATQEFSTEFASEQTMSEPTIEDSLSSFTSDSQEEFDSTDLPTELNDEELNTTEQTEQSDDFVTEKENNDLSDSNINYLTSEDLPDEVLTNESENTELKKDIKSVLLYMDQLLENLPEEKIVEFAKSEEFSTYKKLFSELGLS